MKDPISILRGDSGESAKLTPLPGGFDNKDLSSCEPAPKTPETSNSEQNTDSIGGFGGGDAFEADDSDSPPIDLLPPLLAEFVAETARVSQTPEGMALVPCLGAISASIGAGIEIQTYASKTLRPNIYIILAAESGTGKDECFKIPLKPLLVIEAERLEIWHDDTLPGLKGDLARVTAKLKSLDREKPKLSEDGEHKQSYRELSKEKAQIEKEIEGEPSLIENDITRERLVTAMSAQPGEALASITSEARGAISNIQGRYSAGSSDEDLYAGAFSGTPVKSSRMSRGNNLTRPCLSLVWALQPDAMRGMLGSSAMVESGFLPRCLMVDPHAEPTDIPDEFPEFSPALERKWGALLTTLVETFHDGGKTPKTTKTTSEAYELLRSFDNETKAKRRNGGEYADVTSFAARWPEIAWRLSLILHCVRHGREAGEAELGTADASAAIATVKWFAGETLKLLAEGRTKRKLERYARIVELITGADDHKITLRKLEKHHGFNPVEVARLSASFGGFEVQKIQNPNGGPLSPTAVISVKN